MSLNTQGGFVEIDLRKLDREELVLYGSKIALDMLLTEFMGKANDMGNKAVAGVIAGCAEIIRQRCDAVTMQLSASVIRTKSGSLHELRGDKQ